MFDIVRFWMDMGIDGFRLDAVPYLFEEEGHNGENHPKTHEFLAKLRAMVDDEYPGRILLAEANQPPADVVDYFGTEEAPECQMCFHFPVMPMLYYSLREEKAAPIIDVLADTPADPGGRAVGHVPAQPRRADPRDGHARAARRDVRLVRPRPADARQRRHPAPARAAARQLAPRVRADPRPAAVAARARPCLYYGDEIGMGDNIWLNDRDAVRTPMQWTPDRNAGFSTADPGKLYLPVIQSLVYHHNHVNVEAQMASGSSLLHWVRGMLSVRREHPVFGLGDFEVCAVEPRTGAVLRARSTGASATARTARPWPCSASTTCRRARSRPPSRVPEELWDWETRDLFGGSGFPDIAADGTITITLGSRDFFWLRAGAATR